MNEQFFFNENKTIVLAVDTGGSEAYLKLSDKCIFFNEEEIAELIKRAGVNYGFDNARHITADKNLSRETGKPFLVAKQTASEPPDIEYDLLLPQENFITAVDKTCKQLDELLCKTYVIKNQPLASFRIKGEGKPGIDIFGRDIPVTGKIEEIASNFCGEGVVYEDNIFIAGVHGFPYIDDKNRISIASLITFDGNLHLNEKICRLPCSFLITGSISGKGLLQVAGDLAIANNVSHCRIISAGKILVKGVCDSSVLFAEDSIGINKASLSRIAAGKNLRVENSVSRSLLIAGQSVTGNKDSVCDGCYVYAGLSIDLDAVLQTQMSGTALNISYAPYAREFFAFLEEHGTILEPDERKELTDKMQRLILAGFPLDDELPSASQDLSITIRSNLPRASEIRILSAETTTTGEKHHTTFKLENNLLTFNSI